MWSPVPFKKHAGRTLPQILFADPDWFFELHARGAFHGRLKVEADAIYRRARSIRVPDLNGHPRVAEYVVHPLYGRLSGLSLVRSDAPRRSQGERRRVIDMSYPREHAKYDKLGAQIVVDVIKAEILRVLRMTKARSEAFFDDPSNFVERRRTAPPSKWIVKAPKARRTLL